MRAKRGEEFGRWAGLPGFSIRYSYWAGPRNKTIIRPKSNKQLFSELLNKLNE